MPCDSIRRYSVDFKVGDFNLLGKALKSMNVRNFYVDVESKQATFWFNGQTVSIYGGQITVQAGYESLIDQIKVAYSQEVVKEAAEQFDLIYSPVENAQNQVELQWRY